MIAEKVQYRRMDALKLEILKAYGTTSRWKQRADRFFKPGNAVNVYRGLAQAGFIPSPEKDFVFVSPTANKPTHEHAIFEEDSKTRTGRGTFLTGDMCDVGPEGTFTRRGRVKNSRFRFKKLDAESLAIRPGRVHCLWDRKGWLWHLADNGDAERLIQTLDSYAVLLAENGIVVTDFSPEYRRTMMSLTDAELRAARFRYRANRLGVWDGPIYPEHVEGEFEPSTVWKIMELNKQYPQVVPELEARFDIFKIGKGPERVAVFRKKSESARAAV